MNARYDSMSPINRRGTEIVTRTFKVFGFDSHPRRKILIIRGEALVSVSSVVGGEVIAEETREFKKVIRLESLSDITNTEDVADEVMNECPYIADNLRQNLLAAIDVLKYRQYDHHGMAILPSDEDGTLPDYFEDDELKCEADMKDVKMDSLDLYLELLYEDLPDKVKGARSIWRLTTMSENLIVINDHSTALNAIFRTLREDYKKSMELTTNLLNIVASFAKYRDFHVRLITSKICSLTMNILDFELGRYENWIETLKEKKELADSASSPNSKAAHEFEKIKIKFTDLIRKQDNLLAVCFEVIKYFCDRKAYIQQLYKKGIVRKLISVSERSNVKLLTVVIGFLHNMSTFTEYKDKMAEFNIIEALCKLVKRNIPSNLLKVITALLYNLTFDTKLRQKMIKLDLLPKIASAYEDPEIRPIALLILYNMSIDHSNRPKFIQPNMTIVPMFMERLCEPRDGGAEVEVLGLVLNLAASKRCCQVICASNRLSALVKAALQRQDPLLMKLVHKISEHEGPTKQLFRELVNNIVAAVSEKAKKEFVIEIIGTLSNLTLPDIDFSDLLQGYKLMPYIKSVIEGKIPASRERVGLKRSTEESLLLEVVIFIASCGNEPGCSDYLIQEGVAEHLFELSNTIELDVDVRLQILYAFYKLASHNASRAYIVEKTRIPMLVRNFCHAESPAIREAAEAAWNVIGEHSAVWRDRVQLERFLAHNAPWFETVSSSKELECEELEAFKEELENFYQRLRKDVQSSPASMVQRNKSARRQNEKRARAIKASGSTTESQVSDDSEGTESSEDEDANDRANSCPRESESDEETSEEAGELFNQVRHQFNEEMQERERYGLSDEEEIFEDDESMNFDGGARARDNETGKSRMYKKNESRPQTAKTRPTTAAPGRISRLQNVPK